MGHDKEEPALDGEPGGGGSSTIIIVLVVVGLLLALLCGGGFFALQRFTLTAKAKARVAITSAQIRSLTVALEAYNTDQGLYPGAGAATGADLAPLMYAGLFNKPTAALGGGVNTPYYDAEKRDIGVIEPTGIGALAPSANPHSSSFQTAHAAAFSEKPEEWSGLEPWQGAAVFLDPWGRPFHYREWASKPDSLKDELLEAGDPSRRPHNVNRFDIWSDGPDGVNQYGAPGSDDITNWGQ